MSADGSRRYRQKVIRRPPAIGTQHRYIWFSDLHCAWTFIDMQLGPLLVASILVPLVFGVLGYVYWRERKMSHRAMRVPDDDPATANMSATILNGTTVVIGYFFAVFFRRRITGAASTSW